MKKIVLASVYIILGGFAISEVVGYSDPNLSNPFSDLTNEEIVQGVPTLVVAAGEDQALTEPPYEKMATVEGVY